MEAVVPALDTRSQPALTMSARRNNDLFHHYDNNNNNIHSCSNNAIPKLRPTQTSTIITPRSPAKASFLRTPPSLPLSHSRHRLKSSPARELPFLIHGLNFSSYDADFQPREASGGDFRVVELEKEEC